MKLEFKEYVVNSEIDFIEDEIDKIKAHLTVVAKIAEDINNKLPPFTFDLYVVNLNTQTGIEMDEQRLNEAVEFVASKFQQL